MRRISGGIRIESFSTTSILNQMIFENFLLSLTVYQTKYKNLLDVEDNLQLYHSTLTPNVTEMSNGSKQAHSLNFKNLLILKLRLNVK